MTPATSAVLRIAPKFPGSVTPSSAMTRGGIGEELEVKVSISTGRIDSA